MVWKTGQSGNPTGNQGPKAKPMRDALRLELAAAEIDDEPVPVRPGTMRDLARAVIAKARTGDVSAYIEVANRIDGKVAQPIAGDDESPPARMELIWLTGLNQLHDLSSRTALENHSAPYTNGANGGQPLSPTDEPEKP
jgi:hypothetical protein